MSLYNTIFGYHPMAPLCMRMLDFKPRDVGRFRDAYFAEENGETVIAIYTRNGGGNRRCWSWPDEELCDGDCTGCTQTSVLPAHPLYVRDEDDDFDPTYCTTYFKIPPQYLALVEEVLCRHEGAKPEISPGARFSQLIDRMQAGDHEDEEVQRAVKVCEEVFRALFEACEPETVNSS